MKTHLSKKIKINYTFLYLIIIPFNILLAQKNDVKHPILKDEFLSSVGVFLPSKKVSIGVDGSTPNDKINFNSSFNLNNNEVTPFLNFAWRFAKKWKLGVEYFSIKNANKATLKEDIVFENITFKKGTNTRGGFGLNMYRVFVGRSFLRGLKYEFGAGLGIHALNTNAFIEGNILISEGDINFERRAVSASIPLPNLGLWYFYTPTTKLAFIARVDWFGLTLGKYSGILWNIAPGIKYQVFKNIGFGVDYRFFRFKANVNQSRWKGNFDMTFHGLLFVININF